MLNETFSVIFKHRDHSLLCTVVLIKIHVFWLECLDFYILWSSCQMHFNGREGNQKYLQDYLKSIVHEKKQLNKPNDFHIWIWCLHAKYTFQRLLAGVRCLKITEKVSFNIASKASYVYILSGQKLIKNAKMDHFGEFFENLKLAVKQCYQTGQF